MFGGHRVKAFGCELVEKPRYQSHMCKGRFKFKNNLGIEDEESYTMYFRKYEGGEINLSIVEIGGRIVFDAELNN